jgi:hypothetical protein
MGFGRRPRRTVIPSLARDLALTLLRPQVSPSLVIRHSSLVTASLLATLHASLVTAPVLSGL